MSRLSLYCPPDVAHQDEPRILSFATFAARMKGNELFDVVTRARATHQNRQCPRCGRASVEPLELHDRALNRHGAVIPASATVVGFCCGRCAHQWRA